MNKSLHNVSIIVPAAGAGTRMAADCSKQYLLLKKKPILEHCLEKLFSLKPRQIILVVAPDDERWRDIGITADCEVVRGGMTRADSVQNGLLSLQAYENDWVMVHDCARPCVVNDDILNLYNKLENHDVGGLLGVPVIDTLKRVSSLNEIVDTAPRSEYWLAQTPQMFRYGVLRAALTRVQRSKDSLITDEASAVEFLGYKPVMIQGSRQNIKITTPDDLALAEYYLGRD